jgi:hypothetical protein
MKADSPPSLIMGRRGFCSKVAKHQRVKETEQEFQWPEGPYEQSPGLARLYLWRAKAPGWIITVASQNCGRIRDAAGIMLMPSITSHPAREAGDGF